MSLSIGLQHVARQLQFIVTEKFFVLGNGFVICRSVEQGASCLLKVGSDLCPQFRLVRVKLSSISGSSIRLRGVINLISDFRGQKIAVFRLIRNRTR